MSTTGELFQTPAIPTSNWVGANEAVEDNDDPTKESSAKILVDGKKLDELLEALGSQLESQQQQLDLFRGLKIPKEAPKSTPTPTFNNCKYESFGQTERVQAAHI
jgi:hypothetical protein